MFETAGGGPIALDKATFYLTYQFGRECGMAPLLRLLPEMNLFLATDV